MDEAYDWLAGTYERREADCADLEFPATTDLVRGVTGKRVLDAGCGTGRYAEWSVEQGADVVAVDRNTDTAWALRGETARVLRETPDVPDVNLYQSVENWRVIGVSIRNCPPFTSTDLS